MKNKKGNVAVIAIIIVIVVITIGVIAWLIATKTQVPVQQIVVTQKSTQPVTATQPKAQPATTQIGYFEIKELGIKFPINPTIASDIEYKIANGDETEGKYAILSSKKLQGKENNCTTGINLYKISGKPSDYPKYTDAQTLGDYFNQYDGFFTIINGPQNYCSEDQAIIKDSIDFVQSIFEPLKNISLINNKL